MDAAILFAAEVNHRAWSLLKGSLQDVSDEEALWRPLPQSNSITSIVRHLAIEAEWHLDSLVHGREMPTDVTPAMQQAIDSVPLDFKRNREKLEELYPAFLEALLETTLGGLRQRTAAAYGEAAADPGSAHLLGYHQALHIASHCGQIRTIRNLYRKTRGQPPLFFPENPTYPR